MTLPPDPDLSPCLDCGAARVGPFCHACGQGEVDPRATVRELAGGAVRAAVAWDERALQTLRVLVTQPGALSRAWAEGQRTRFVPPLRLFLVLGAVLVALGALHRRLALWLVAAPPPSAADWLEPSTESAGYWLGRGMVWLGLNAVLILVPLVGFAYFVLFHARWPRLAPHLVHALHVGCVAVLGLIVWRLAALAWLAGLPAQTLGDALDPTASGLGLLEGLLLLWLGGVTVYAAVSVRRFYGATRARAALAAPLVVAVPLAALVGVAFVVYLVLLVR